MVKCNQEKVQYGYWLRVSAQHKLANFIAKEVKPDKLEIVPYVTLKPLSWFNWKAEYLTKKSLKVLLTIFANRGKMTALQSKGYSINDFRRTFYSFENNKFRHLNI